MRASHRPSGRRVTLPSLLPRLPDMAILPLVQLTCHKLMQCECWNPSCPPHLHAADLPPHHQAVEKRSPEAHGLSRFLDGQQDLRERHWVAFRFIHHFWSSPTLCSRLAARLVERRRLHAHPDALPIPPLVEGRTPLAVICLHPVVEPGEEVRRVRLWEGVR